MTQRMDRKKEQIGGTEGRGRQEDQKGGEKWRVRAKDTYPFLENSNGLAHLQHE